MMKTSYGRDGTSASGALERQLSGWLRGFDPGEAPIGLRVRISADLRTQTGRRHGGIPLLASGLLSAAAFVVVLIGAALVVLAAGAGGAASTVGSLNSAWPGQTVPPPTDVQVSGGLTLTWLAALLIVAGLVGASATTAPIRRMGRRLFVTSRSVQPARVFPRRIRDIPRLAFALALLAILETVWSLYAYGIPLTSPDWLLTQLLPLGLGPAIALRHWPPADRSARWLLVGAIAIAVANLPGLALMTAAQWGWFDNTDLGGTLSDMLPFVVLSITALGWLSIGAGVAARSGVARLPRRPIVAAAVALVLFSEIAGSINFAAMIDAQMPLAPRDTARIAWETVTTCIQNLAWLAILWTALARTLQRGANQAWMLALVAAVTSVALRLYAPLVSAGWLPFVDWQVLMLLSWLGAATLLMAVLIGLNSSGNAQADPLDAAG